MYRKRHRRIVFRRIEHSQFELLRLDVKALQLLAAVISRRDIGIPLPLDARKQRSSCGTSTRPMSKAPRASALAVLRTAAPPFCSSMRTNLMVAPAAGALLREPLVTCPAMRTGAASHTPANIRVLSRRKIRFM
jgi:hypothetical protein